MSGQPANSTSHRGVAKATWMIALALVVCLPVAGWRLANPLPHPRFSTMDIDFSRRIADGNYMWAWRRTLELVAMEPHNERAVYLNRMAALLHNHMDPVEPQAAYAEALRMLEEDPDDPNLNLVAAELALMLDRPLESAELAQKALSLEPEMTRARELLEEARQIP